MGQATSRPQVADGVDGRGPASANLIWLSGQQNFHSGPGEGFPPPLPLGELGVKLKAQLPALPHECILWAISPCCIPSSEVGQTSSSWAGERHHLMTISPVKGVRRGAQEAKGVGSLGLQVAVWGLLEGSFPPAASWLWDVDHPALP